MKTIGLLGGMSWESTIPYYRIINRGVNERLGGLHSAKILLYSVDFDAIERLQHEDRWEEAGDVLVDAARRLETAGADFLILCTNTMHKLAPQLEDALDIPMLHIADATADAIRDAGINAVGLLGTRFTMEQDFYRGRLEEKHGLRVLTPDEAGRAAVHDVIYHELCHGKVLDESRRRFVTVIDQLAGRGAEGVILGCTEIAMLTDGAQTAVPLFDTTTIHAAKAIQWALAES
ncbi:MAG: aspartate/glutamate racemase family protein [Planctomycetota bacterium]|nr:aspartate/glutamate racemase family protein [Planctomycetota bacterium]